MGNRGIATNWVSLEKLSLVYFFASTKFSKKRSQDACRLWFRSFDGSCSAMTSKRPPPASHEKGSRLVLSAEWRGTSRLVRRLLIRIWGGRGGSSPWRKEKERTEEYCSSSSDTDRTRRSMVCHGVTFIQTYIARIINQSPPSLLTHTYTAPWFQSPLWGLMATFRSIHVYIGPGR